MNWDAIGASAELLGAIAVLLTLVYLALQVRHASHQVKLSLQQTRHATFRENCLVAAQDSRIASVITKTEQIWAPDIESEEELFARAALTPDEITVWLYYQRAWWSYFREMIANVDELSGSHVDEINRELLIMYRDTPPKVYFNSMKSLDSPAVNYVTELLAKEGPPPNMLLEPDA